MRDSELCEGNAGEVYEVIKLEMIVMRNTIANSTKKYSLALKSAEPRVTSPTCEGTGKGALVYII